MFRDYLSHDKLIETGYFSPAFIDYALAEHDGNSNIDFSGVLVVVFFVQLWHDIFLNKAI